MASAATLQLSSLRFPSCEFSRCGGIGRGTRIRRIAKGVRCWGGPLQRRTIEHRVVRMTRGDNDVAMEEKAKEEEKEEDEEPLLLRMGVSFFTEALRLFSSFGSSQSATAIQEAEPSPAVVESQNVLQVLREDYERAYFLTGDFTPTLYADDCLFADPTIQYRGRDKYQRNLKLLVPFFEEPTLTLFDIQEEGHHFPVSINFNERASLNHTMASFCRKVVY